MYQWRSTTAAVLLFCADGAQNPANDANSILTRVEAARYLRISVRAFDMHVRGRVPEHRIGRKPLFRKADLESWLDLQKVGGYGSAETATRCDSPMLVNASSSPRAQEILRKLRGARPNSTPNTTPTRQSAG
jgi:excisionase family DNA binding protein